MDTIGSAEIQISFDSAESATMVGGEGAYIFRFDVKNLHSKRAKIFVSSPIYTTCEGEEIDQDAWLAGLGNGVNGFTLSSGTFKKIGCVYYDSKLPRISKGDKLQLTAWIDGGHLLHEFIFECVDAAAKSFELISSTLESEAVDGTGLVAPSAASNQDEDKAEITHLVEQLELMEEKFNISIDGLYATCEKQAWRKVPNYEIKLNFDVAGTGADLQQSFHIRANAYNAQGQLLGTKTTFIHAENFFGFQSEAIQFEIDHPPIKLRLFPCDPLSR